MGSTDRPLDAAPRHQAPVHHPAGNDPLARALSRARWTIFWERLWPALASIATVIGLFLAVSWLGLWLWLPPIRNWHAPRGRLRGHDASTQASAVAGRV